MQYVARAVVRGATQFAGEIDGQRLDTAAIFVDVELNDKQGGMGSRTEAKRCESGKVLDALKGVKLPHECELLFVELATKGKTSTVCMQIKPMAKAA